MKFYTLFLMTLISSVSLAEVKIVPSDMPVFSDSVVKTKEVPAAREQYSLKLNKTFPNQCQLALFINKTGTHFIKKVFSPSSTVLLGDILKNQDEYLSQEVEKFNLDQTLEGKTKNHIFYSKDGSIFIKFLIQNKETKEFSADEVMLFKKITC